MSVISSCKEKATNGTLRGETKMKQEITRHPKIAANLCITIMKLIMVICIAIVFEGCTNPYSQFYQSNIGSASVEEIPTLIPHLGEPCCYRGFDPDSDSQDMLQNGYVMIGYSSFNSGSVGSSGAISQAKKLKAATVYIYSRYTHTVSGVMPLTTKNPDTTITTYNSGNLYGSMSATHQGAIYGMRKPVTYSGQSFGSYSGSYSGYSTTTIPGGYTTQYIPYSKDRYDFYATYWALAGNRPLDANIKQGETSKGNIIYGRPSVKGKHSKKTFIGIKIEDSD